MRYGENPHQKAAFFGNLTELFEQLNGKELSYNNLVDMDAATLLISEFDSDTAPVFAIIKHTNVCGIALRNTTKDAWDAALAGDPESAFGGVLVCNGIIDKPTADAINEIFFEVLIAPAFNEDALTILKSKKNRILLRQKAKDKGQKEEMHRSLLNGVLIQQTDEGSYAEWKETGARETRYGICQYSLQAP
jgi:phosphoribosylaminoimidazolecarboxamide formyltransferase/IMP cyclohydrolase